MPKATWNEVWNFEKKHSPFIRIFMPFWVGLLWFGSDVIFAIYRDNLSVHNIVSFEAVFVGILSPFMLSMAEFGIRDFLQQKKTYFAKWELLFAPATLLGVFLGTILIFESWINILIVASIYTAGRVFELWLLTLLTFVSWKFQPKSMIDEIKGV